MNDATTNKTSEAKCSYKCPHYDSGAVLTWCSKYKTQLKHAGGTPALMCLRCVIKGQAAIL